MKLLKNHSKYRKKEEVEIRAILDSKKRAVIETKLTERGAKFEDKAQITDIYLCPSSVNSFEEIEMNKVGSYSLRIRKQITDEQEEVSINTKIITTEGDHNAWQEYEIDVSSFDVALAIFRAIGFKPFFTLEKDRYIFKLDNMTICVEDIVGFGSTIEIEVIADASASQRAKKEIRTFLKEMDIDNNQLVPRSITNLLMQQKAKF